MALRELLEACGAGEYYANFVGEGFAESTTAAELASLALRYGHFSLPKSVQTHGSAASLAS